VPAVCAVGVVVVLVHVATVVSLVVAHDPNLRESSPACSKALLSSSMMCWSASP
jgi:hypothetical protein